MLGAMKDKEKLEALKSQIRFRKNILHQTSSNPKLFNFSKIINTKRKDLTWKEMMENVKILVQESFSLPIQPHSNKSTTERLSLVGKDIQHKFVTDKQVQWYDGHVISQVSALLQFLHAVFIGKMETFLFVLILFTRAVPEIIV